MTKQQELEIYKIALLDWSSNNHLLTHWGFCKYFINKIFPEELERELLFIDDYKIAFPTLYSLRKTDLDDISTSWWFHYTGDNLIGRTQRIDALKKAIKILENELKTENHE